MYITKDGLVKLKAELNHLITVERQKIAERIQEAKELGDISENAEYSAAKDEQSFLEMKIAELDNIIKNASIIEEHNHSKNMVSVGSTVVFLDGTDQEREYTIVGSQEANPTLGKISNESPLGRAFLGQKVGDTVEFQAPKGPVSFIIKDIK